MRLFRSALLLALLATPTMVVAGEKHADTPDAATAKTMDAFFAAWNTHDAKTMVSYWADDATLINPVGRAAHGKSEIEKLMADEQSTVFKASTAKLVDLKVTRSFGSGMAFCDGEMTLDGAVGPDGTALPQMKLHLALIMEKKGAGWLVKDARPFMFLPAPPENQN